MSKLAYPHVFLLLLSAKYLHTYLLKFLSQNEWIKLAKHVYYFFSRRRIVIKLKNNVFFLIFIQLAVSLHL